MKKSRIYIIIGIVVAVVIVGTIIATVIIKNNNVVDNDKGTPSQNNQNTENVTITDDGTKQNNSTKLIEEKQYDGLIINEIGLSSKDGLTKFTAQVVNNTDEDKAGRPVTIVFLDKNNKEVSKIDAYIGQTKKGMSSTINSSATTDLANAYDFRVESK